ncbi:MAG: N-acetyltransferase [Crocinitomicaceae bacterium]|nr:N-acetyltransferase [Crocinitomicaceae bacterium]
MTVQQSESDSKGSFFIELDGKKHTEMTCSKACTDRIIIDHTEVDPELRGTGAGKKMVEAAVLYAREKGISIIPLCVFARSVFDKTPEYKDVLYINTYQ